MLHAAVIVPIVRRADPTLVVVRRAPHLRRNPGEVAFPGGLIDAGDADARATALREFEEELGVASDRVAIVDRLADVVTLALSVTIAPFVGTLAPPDAFAADDNEIASVREIPLHAIYVPGALHPGTERVERDGRRCEVPTWIFDYDGLHVWGATARIMRDLLARYPAIDGLLARTQT
jgi:8-oxo-dGTP pyrophosphatase MutT (NUDIX family)